MAIGDIIRYAVLTIVFLIVLVFGMKWWGKQRTEKEIVAELRVLTSPSSSFEQFNAEDTRKTLFKSLYQLHLAESELGLGPAETLDKVYHVKKGGFFSSDDSNDSYYRNYSQELVRESLMRNYEMSNRLGLFDDSIGRDALQKGESAQIQNGASKGKWVDITFIIDPKVSPGIEKIVPNLVVHPPLEDGADAGPTEFDVARAKKLANALGNDNRLERQALQRIIKYYDEVHKPAEPAEKKGTTEPAPATIAP